MLAIIIPYYKFTFFEETLQSLASQTDKRFKVYIGDDASPENPKDLLKKYQGQFEYVYQRFDENVGGISLTKQWDRCIELSADEEWLMILGDDDMLGGNVVEEFYQELVEVIKYDINAIRYSTYKIDEKGGLISGIYEHPKLENAIDFLFRKTRSSLSEYIFKTDQVKKIGFKDFSLGWFSDVLAVLEFSNFKNIFTINKAQVFIRITNLSISGKQDNLILKRKSVFEFYYHLINIELNHFNPTQSVKLFEQINKSYISDKKNYVLFVKLTWFYLFHFLYVEYLQFLKSITINVLRNENRI